MKIYVLTHDGLFRNLVVTTHPDAASAEAWLAASKKVGGEVVADEADLKNKVKGASLVVLYNYLAAIDHSRRYEGQTDAPAAKTVSKFETSLVGARRCFVLVEELFQTKTPEAAAPPTVEDAATPAGENSGDAETTTEEDDMVSKKGKKSKKAAKAKGEKKSSPKKPTKVIERDAFGLRVDSMASKAAAMFARSKGATMDEVKAALGGTWYGLVRELSEKKGIVRKEGTTIFFKKPA